MVGLMQNTCATAVRGTLVAAVWVVPSIANWRTRPFRASKTVQIATALTHGVEILIRLQDSIARVQKWTAEPK